MTQSAQRFAKLLTEAIYQIRLREHKNIAIVQDEVGYAIGREGGSAIEYWRKGHIPKDREEIELLAQELVERGKLEQDWLEAFLDSADYILPEPLIQDIFPAKPALHTKQTAPTITIRQEKTQHFLLPVPPHQLYGRDQALTSINQLLDDEKCRLLTIVGPGGIGKTRLSLEVGHSLRRDGKFEDGIVFASLASLSDAKEIPSVLASTLNLPLNTSQDILDQISTYLESLDLLFIIDNFDLFVNDGGVYIAELLQRTSRLKIIITTREKLNLRWEHVYALKGLDVEQNRSQTSAISFFKEIVRRFAPDYQFTADDERAIKQICYSVEGFPLALELAASWSNILSCREIADEIDQSMDILSTSQQDMPDRHKSLRAVCNYSFETLSDREKEIFTKLSVFRGGFTRMAANRVTGASLADLSRLVNKSLLRSAGRNRFDMHQILYQFAQEQLDGQPELKMEMQAAHCRYYCSRLGDIVPSLATFDHQSMLRDVAIDLENVRQAWRWAADQGEHGLIDQAVDAIFLFFQMGSRFQEGNVEFNYARERLDPNSLTMARLYNRQGMILRRLSQREASNAVLKRSIEIHETLGETIEIPMAHNFLANNLSETGQFAEALQYLEANLPIPSNDSNLVFKVATQNNMGAALSALGREEEGREAFQRAESYLRELNQAWGLGVYFNFRGDATFRGGHFEEAEQYYREAAATFAEIYYDLGTCMTRAMVGEALLAQNRVAEAERELKQALALAHQTKATQIELRCLKSLAQIPGIFDEQETQEMIPSLLAQHPASESDVRAWGLSQLQGQSRTLIGRQYGEWLATYVQQVLNP